jgi:hypothetical protein
VARVLGTERQARRLLMWEQLAIAAMGLLVAMILYIRWDLGR